MWKNSRKNRFGIDTKGRNIFWPVRHLKPKEPFTTRWERKRGAKDKASSSSCYYVCEEQILRSEKEGNGYEPYEIRPSFIKFRGSAKRNVLLDNTDFFLVSPVKKSKQQPKFKDAIGKHGIINPAPAIGTPPNGQGEQVIEDSSSGDDDLIPMEEIFNNTGKKSASPPPQVPLTPPQVPLTPPTTPARENLPIPQIQDNERFFSCNFQTDTIKFQLTMKK
jgi:hypothetical protein